MQRSATTHRIFLMGLLSLCLLAPPPAASAILDPSNEDHAALREAVQSLHQGHHVDAKNLLNRYIQDFPDDPVGPLLRLKVAWWGILGGRDLRMNLDSELQADFELVRKICRSRLSQDDEDTRALYALGEAWCTKGRLEGLRGHGWSTLRHHQKGTPFLEKALELEPSLVEPLVSLGVFHYYASRAPGFLRFVARFFRVKADRERGLRYLRLATATAGMQQAEAAFFLLEVLTNVEDEQLEALPIALRFQARYPHNLGFRIALSTAQIALGRPDVAVTLLRESIAQRDPHTAISARFFVARALGMTGRAADSAALLESFSSEDVRSVSWLPAWHPYYLGSAYDQLGRLQEARVAYENTVAAEKVADSHGFAKRALDRHRSELDLAMAAGLATLSWHRTVGTTADDLRLILESPQQVDKQQRLQAWYLLGSLELERGEYEAAAMALRQVALESFEEEAWVSTRSRARLLQALLWSGQFDAARETAQRFSADKNQWGSNQHLQLLVDTALHPSSHSIRFERDLVTREGERMEVFRLRDVGFTSVRLLRSRGRKQSMRLQNGVWETSVPLGPGAHSYRYELESQLEIPDPACLLTRDQRGELWSVRQVSMIDPQAFLSGQ